MKFLHISEARPVGGYRVWLRFSDGSAGEADLEHDLEGPVFDPLKDLGYFRQFTLQGHTLTWPNGADFAPEHLHRLTLKSETGHAR